MSARCMHVISRTLDSHLRECRRARPSVHSAICLTFFSWSQVLRVFWCAVCRPEASGACRCTCVVCFANATAVARIRRIAQGAQRSASCLHTCADSSVWDTHTHTHTYARATTNTIHVSPSPLLSLSLALTQTNACSCVCALFISVHRGLSWAPSASSIRRQRVCSTVAARRRTLQCSHRRCGCGVQEQSLCCWSRR